MPATRYFLAEKGVAREAVHLATEPGRMEPATEGLSPRSKLTVPSLS